MKQSPKAVKQSLVHFFGCFSRPNRGFGHEQFRVFIEGNFVFVKPGATVFTCIASQATSWCKPMGGLMVAPFDAAYKIFSVGALRRREPPETPIIRPSIS